MRKYLPLLVAGVAFVAAPIMAAAPSAHAQGYRYYGRGYDDHYRRDNNSVAAAGVLGLLVLGAAAIESHNQPQQSVPTNAVIVVQQTPSYTTSVPYNSGMQVWCHGAYDPFQGQHVECNTFFNGALPPTPGWWRQ